MSSPITITPTIGGPLTVADRCDRCGARALVRAVLPTGGKLLFCGHHGRKHCAALADQGAELRP
jgi:hypothetical protein